MKLFDKWVEWPPRDWRSMLALWASVGGGAIAFILSWRVMTFLANETDWRRDLDQPGQLKVVLAQLAALRMMAMGVMIIMGTSMLGLWFVLGKRSFELEAWKLKLKAGGGEDSLPELPPMPQAPTTVTTTVSIPPAASAAIPQPEVIPTPPEPSRPEGE